MTNEDLEQMERTRFIVWPIKSGGSSGQGDHWGVGWVDQAIGWAAYHDSSLDTRDATGKKWRRQLRDWLRIFGAHDLSNLILNVEIAPITKQNAYWECSVLAIESTRRTFRESDIIKKGTWKIRDWAGKESVMEQELDMRLEKICDQFMRAIRRELGDLEDQPLRLGSDGYRLSPALRPGGPDLIRPNPTTNTLSRRSQSTMMPRGAKRGKGHQLQKPHRT